MSKTKFGSILLLCQGILLILFVVFVDYDDQNVSTSEQETREQVSKLPVFQNLHFMAFLGFGLIMTFLRRYSRGMLVHAFLVGGLVIQWSTLLEGFFNLNEGKIKMSLDRMINADFAVLAVMISFGAVIGKCNSLQYLVIGLLETFFFSVNLFINTYIFQISDQGRSIVVHVFGAYFGLAVSRLLFSRKVCMSQALSMSNESEMYTFLGTLFLWVYWPSLNASFAEGPAKQRAISNTYYALSASCISTFSFTVLQSKEGRFNVLHLQNATIVGGVTVGAVAAMMLHPWGAVIIGIVGALVSVLGYKYIVPNLRRKLKIHDTRGIHVVHGIPGIVSGIASVITAIMASESMYKTSLYDTFPARAPMINTTKYDDLMKHGFAYKPGLDRTAMTQALYQLAGLGTSIVTALIGGLITGLIVRISFFEPLTVNDAFDDHIDFEEANCIDISSEPEYEDDEEKHHDSVRGKKRLLDDHHSDIVVVEESNHKQHRSMNSLDRSEESISKVSHHDDDMEMVEINHQEALTDEDENPLVETTPMEEEEKPE